MCRSCHSRRGYDDVRPTAVRSDAPVTTNNLKNRSASLRIAAQLRDAEGIARLLREAKEAHSGLFDLPEGHDWAEWYGKFLTDRLDEVA